MKLFHQATYQPQQLVAVLILTSFLSLGAGTTLIQAAAVNSLEIPQPSASLKQSRANQPPRSVINTIRREIARSNRIPPGQLRVVSFNQQNWSDSCLGLGRPDEGCAAIIIENGWQVVMSDGRQTWTYRSDRTGNIVRLERQDAPSSNKLPTSVANAVLQAASRQLGVPTSQLRITQSQPQTWSDGCLGLGTLVESCLRALTPGWQVTVEGKQQRLVYRTDESGSQVRLDERASNLAEVNLPSPVAKAVLQAASQRTGLPTSEFRIIKSEQMTTDGCLSLPRPGEACTEIALNAWEVTLEGSQQRLVYRSNSNGTQVRLNEAVSSIGDADLPSAVSRAVLQAASQRTGLPTSEFRVVKVEQIQTNGCLNLPRPGEGCTKINMPAWEVSVEGGQQRLVYRSDPQGSQVRLNEGASNIGNANLPKAVATAVLQNASEQSGLSTAALRIVKAERHSWGYGCERPTFPHPCDPVAVSGWQVTVESGQKRWVYLTDDSGSQVQLNEAGTGNNANVPSAVANAVLQLASQHFSLPASQLRIARGERQTWSDGCLGLPSPVERCMGVETPGWRVTVEGKEQSQVYRTDDSGSRVRTEAIAGLPSRTDNLPNSVALAVLRDVQSRSSVPTSQLYILQAEQQDWPDGCLGLAEAGVGCTQAILSGWRVTVNGGDRSFVYRTNQSGSLIKPDNGTTASGKGDGVQIPSSEVPSPLNKDALFRAVTSGGFAGQTYETTLLNNGQIVRKIITPTVTASTPDITYISPDKLQQFRQVLAKRPLAQFNGLSYPAPQGAADYFTVTLTSRDGTVRYTDMGHNRLPQALQEVIQAWNQVIRG